MATFSRISMDEARQLGLPPRQALKEQYRAYLRQVGEESAGRLELGPDDKPITERAKLKAAARAEGVKLEIQRQGRTLVFWRTEGAPPARTRGGRAARSGGR